MPDIQTPYNPEGKSVHVYRTIVSVLLALMTVFTGYLATMVNKQSDEFRDQQVQVVKDVATINANVNTLNVAVEKLSKTVEDNAATQLMVTRNVDLLLDHERRVRDLERAIWESRSMNGNSRSNSVNPNSGGGPRSRGVP